MLGEPSSASGYEAAEAERRFLHLRFAGGVIGILLIAIGVVCALLVFRKVWAAIEDPRNYAGAIERWEKMIGGGEPLVELSPERLVERQDPSDPTRRLLTVGPGEGTGIRAVRLERPLAVLVLLLLLWLLARIAIGLIGAGGKLVHLASPWKQMLRDVLVEVRGTGSARTR